MNNTIELDGIFKTVFKYGYKKQTLLKEMPSFEAVADGEVTELLISCDGLGIHSELVEIVGMSIWSDRLVSSNFIFDDGDRAVFAVKEGFENYEKMYAHYSQKFGRDESGLVSAFCVRWR